jgi:catechol 2,3-dioxygenase-like lactoylglutathione lyase family enzyme
MASRVDSLHDRLNRISHWDVNVTDLERSRAWYEATTSLRVIARTNASQSFPGFEMGSGSFKGYLLKDANLPRGVPMIHLVQWENPAPVGTPYRSQANVGWYRICPIVDDIEATRQAVIAQGSKPFANTTRAKISFNPSSREIDYRVFTVHDPDGVAVEFVDKLVMGRDGISQVPATVAHNTADVEKYFPFYHELLGLDFIQAAQTQGKVPNVYGPAGGESGFTGAFFGIRGNGFVFFDWLQWIESPELPTPYAEPNHVGIVRCAIEVDDLDAAYEILKRSRWSQQYPILMGGIEEWALGSQWGVRRVLNFKDPEGVAFQLIEQQPSAPGVLHPYGRGAQFGEHREAI